MKISTVLLAAVSVLSANAATISFSQGFNESLVGPFTAIEAMATSGTTIFTATDGGTLINDQYQVWNFDPAIDNFNFTLAGTAEDLGVVDFFALNGSDVIDGATFQCAGGCSFVANIAPESYASQRSWDVAQTAAPEPGSVSLLGAGLIGLSFVLKRKRKV
jgi:hypothetical protein